MEDQVIHIVCRLHCSEENDEEVERLVAALVEPTRNESGCVYYNAFREKDKKGSFFLEDGWKDEEAIKKHLKHPNVVSIMQKLSPLLLHEPELTYGCHIAQK